MKRLIGFLLVVALYFPYASSQDAGIEGQILRKLDSIRKTTTIAAHFADLYYQTTERVVHFLEDKPVATVAFIQRLETVFAGYFFSAVDSFSNEKPVPKVWSAYFSDSALSPFQYKLLGINAHINGDIWKALTAAFTAEELNKNKSAYYSFKKELIKQYSSFYESFVEASFTTKIFDAATLGLSKWYGKTRLNKWRKWQIKLAGYYLTGDKRFDKLYTRVDKKMLRINHLILNTL